MSSSFKSNKMIKIALSLKNYKLAKNLEAKVSVVRLHKVLLIYLD